MTTLNIKKLSVGMSLKDKAKLCFADRLKRAETDGREWVITAGEREAIYADARKNNQMKGLGELISKYNVVVFLWADAKENFRVFSIMKGVVNYTEYILNNMPPEVPEELKDSMFRFDVASFEAPYTNGISPIELHIIVVMQAKLLRKIIYRIDYIERLADFSFLSDEMRNDLKGYEKVIAESEELPEEHTQLSQKDKEEAEEEANWMIDRFSTINFDTKDRL